MGVPLAEKTKLEVFGKGSGEEPFLCIVFLTQLIMYYLRGGHPRRFLLCKLSHAKLVHLSVKPERFVRMKCKVNDYMITTGP